VREKRPLKKSGMTLALKISRAALVISIIGCLSIFALGWVGLIGPLPFMILGAYSGIPVALSAAACVLFQGLILIARKRPAGIYLIAVLIATVSVVVSGLVYLHRSITGWTPSLH
jgi:hypothetical protein